MSLQAFEDMMTHSIDLVKQAKDVAGSLTEDQRFSGEPAFVQYGSKRMINEQGEEITAKAIVFLPADSNYDPDHPLWQVEHGSRTMKVAAPETVDDPRTGKTHHYELGVI